MCVWRGGVGGGEGGGGEKKVGGGGRIESYCMTDDLASPAFFSREVARASLWGPS